MTDNADLPPGSFDKDDAGDDLAFYAPPRLVTHINEVAIAALEPRKFHVLTYKHKPAKDIVDLLMARAKDGDKSRSGAMKPRSAPQVR